MSTIQERQIIMQTFRTTILEQAWLC